MGPVQVLGPGLRVVVGLRAFVVFPCFWGCRVVQSTRVQGVGFCARTLPPSVDLAVFGSVAAFVRQPVLE